MPPFLSVKGFVYKLATSQPLIIPMVKWARVNIFIDLPRLPIYCGKYFTMVNVSHVNTAFTVAASPFFRYFSQSVRRSVVIVCFPPIGICFSFLIKLSEYNPDLEWCETTFISVVFDVLSASHVHDAPRKVPRIFYFSKTLPSLVHFPAMKEPCIWEIYTLSLQCWAFFLFLYSNASFEGNYLQYWLDVQNFRFRTKIILVCYTTAQCLCAS